MTWEVDIDLGGNKFNQGRGRYSFLQKKRFCSLDLVPKVFRVGRKSTWEDWSSYGILSHFRVFRKVQKQTSLLTKRLQRLTGQSVHEQ